MQRPRSYCRRVGALACALLLAALVTDCDGCSCAGGDSPQVPETPEARLDACASALPAQTDLAFFFTDMEGVRGSLGALSKRFKGSLPVDAYRAEIITLVGVDLLERSTYRRAGIDPDGGFCVAIYRETPVLLLYVVDAEKFRSSAVESIRRYYRADAEAAQVMPGRFRVDDPGLDLAWQRVGGGLTAVVFGRVGSRKAPRSSVEVLDELVALDANASVGTLEEFGAFRRTIATQWPASMYMNTPRLLSLYKSLGPSLEKYQAEVIDAAGEQIRWSGLGWRADTEAVRGRLFLGLRADTMAKLGALEEPSGPSPRFHRMVAKGALLVVRVGINPKVFWREYQAAIPERQRNYIHRILRNVKAST
jgi:hypothetical protein